jgi:hypothetical protein
MREAKQIELNGRKYLIGHWQVDKSLKTLVWLTKTFGEGFVSLFTSSVGTDFLMGGSEPVEGETPAKETSQEDEAQVIKDFVSSIVDRLDEDAYVKYAKHIVEGVKVGGQSINFNQHFIGRMGELHHLMFEVLKLQYADFLGGGQESDSSEG